MLNLMYITNKLDVALVAEKYGVDRIWVDLETLGKEVRQKGMNTVKSNHSIDDIRCIKPHLTKSEMLVRVNPWNEKSLEEINAVVSAGADIIMLPMWKSVEDVSNFLKAVDGRCKTTLLLETKEAVESLDEVLDYGGMDEIHIGLNDLHLAYGMNFMFEPLANGLVELILNKIKRIGIPYGFGGIAKLGDGLLPAEKIIMEHYRFGSTRAILSRTFCDNAVVNSIEEIDRVFKLNMDALRNYEVEVEKMKDIDFEKNKKEVVEKVAEVVAMLQKKRKESLKQ